MDQRLKKAIDFSNYAVTLSNQKRILNEKFKESCVYYFNGSQFTITQEIIGFCQALAHNTSIILIDDNGIPVKIDNLLSFTADIIEIYTNASNEYLDEYNELKKSRSVEKLINYE